MFQTLHWRVVSLQTTGIILSISLSWGQLQPFLAALACTDKEGSRPFRELVSHCSEHHSFNSSGTSAASWGWLNMGVPWTPRMGDFLSIPSRYGCGSKPMVPFWCGWTTHSRTYFSGIGMFTPYRNIPDKVSSRKSGVQAVARLLPRFDLLKAPDTS